MVLKHWLKNFTASRTSHRSRRTAQKQANWQSEVCEPRLLLSAANEFGCQAEVILNDQSETVPFQDAGAGADRPDSFVSTGWGRRTPQNNVAPPFRAFVVNWEAIRDGRVPIKPGVPNNTTRVAIDQSVSRFASDAVTGTGNYREVFRVINLPERWTGRWTRPEVSGTLETEGVKDNQIGRDFRVDEWGTSQIQLELRNRDGQKVHTFEFRRLITSDLVGERSGPSTVNVGDSASYALTVSNIGNIPYRNGGFARYELRDLAGVSQGSGQVAIPVIPNGSSAVLTTPAIPFANEGNYRLAWTLNTGEGFDGQIDAGNGTGSGFEVEERDSFANQNFLRVTNNDVFDYLIQVKCPVAPPTLSVTSAVVTINEGDVASNSGMFGDACGPASLTASVLGLSTSGSTWNWSNLYLDETSFDVDLTATDSDNLEVKKSFRVNVLNVAPTAVINDASLPQIEGSPIRIQASATDPGVLDVLTYSYTVQNVATGELVSSEAGVNLTEIQFTPKSDGVYEVILVVTDNDGAASQPVSQRITVANQAPEFVNVTVTPSIKENDEATLVATVSDPGDDELTLTVDWADGTTPTVVTIPAGETEVSVSHRYVDDGAFPGNGTSADDYEILVSLTDDAAATAFATATVTVSNVDPVLNGIPEFSVAEFLVTGTNDILGFDLADIDQDGDLDLASASRLDNRVAWYSNDGAGNFTAMNLASLDDAIEVKAGDLDGDGDVDLVVSAVDGRQIRLYENDGNQNFTVQTLITGIRGNQLVLSDLDGDSDLDVVYGTQDGAVGWLENLGGNAVANRALLSGVGVAREVTVGDVNADGRPDVLVASRSTSAASSSGVWLLTNNGDQTFGSTSLTSGTGIIYAGVDQLDIDGDGDVDVVATDETNDQLLIFTNEAGTFSESVITTDLDGPEIIHVTDVNGDGFDDLLVSGVLSDSVAFFRNDGAGNLTEFPAASGIDGARNILTGDLDGDGRAEIITDARFGDGIVGFEYLGDRLPDLTAISEGGTATLQATYSDIGSEDLHTVDIDWGDGTVDRDVAVAGGVISESHVYADDGQYTIEVTLRDDDQGATSAFALVTVQNVGPTIHLGDDCVVQEGSSVSLDLTNITDPGDDTISSIIVDWGDGNTNTYSSAAVVNHVYADGPGDFVIRVTLIDEDGTWTEAAANTVVSYESTLVDLDSTLIARYRLDGDISDSSGLADGVIVGGAEFDSGLVGDALVANHGQYGHVQPPTAFVGGNNTFSTSLHFQVDGFNAPLNWSPLMVMQRNEFDEGAFFALMTTDTPGDTLRLGLHGGDVGDSSQFQVIEAVFPESLLGSWHQAGYSVDRTNNEVNLYLNGEKVASEILTVGSLDSTKGIYVGQFEFRNARNGHPKFVGGDDTKVDDLLIFDSALTESQYRDLSLTPVRPFQKVVTVRNVAPVVESLSSAVIDENGVATITGSFSDVGRLDSHTVEVTWGDGTTSFATVDAASRTFTASYQYLDDDPTATSSDVYYIGVTVTDDDSGVATATSTVTVRNVAPVVESLSSAVIDENGVATITGSFSDVGRLDSHTVEVTWGDGTTSFAIVDAASRTFTASYQYLDDDPTATSSDVYDIGVTVTDDDSGVATATSTVTVKNVAPEFTGLSSSHAGFCDSSADGLVTIDGSFFDIGSLDTHTVTVDWGDGSAVETIAGVDQLLDTFSAGHQYSTGGLYLVTVTLTDDDGDSVTSTAEAVVQGIGLVDGTLYIIGTDGDDSVKLRQRHGVIHADVKLDGEWRGWGWHGRYVYQNQSHTHYDPALVNDIYVSLCDGNDHADLWVNSDTDVTVDAGAGNDTVWTAGADDTVFGGDGNDRIRTFAGNDTVDAGDGNNQVWSGDGDDIVVAGTGHDWISSGDGNDSIHIVAGNNTVYAGNGDDVVVTGLGQDCIDGGCDNDQISSGAGNDLIYGGHGDDIIDSGAGDDCVHGGAGADRINAGGGSDWIDGGNGNDVILAGAGNDNVDAGSGDDLVVAGDGDDDVDGGRGSDVVIGGNGADWLNGGKGDDLLIAGSTVYDENETALEAIFSEWTDNATYLERVDNLQNGTGAHLAGVNLNSGTTVMGDSDRDVLKGGQGQDYFFAAASDRLRDRKRNEIFDFLTDV